MESRHLPAFTVCLKLGTCPERVVFFLCWSLTTSVMAMLNEEYGLRGLYDMGRTGGLWESLY